MGEIKKGTQRQKTGKGEKGKRTEGEWYKIYGKKSGAERNIIGSTGTEERRKEEISD